MSLSEHIHYTRDRKKVTMATEIFHRLWRQITLSILYLTLAFTMVHLQLNLWQNDAFIYLFSALALYQNLGHLSYAITEHHELNKKNWALINYNCVVLMDVYIHAMYVPILAYPFGHYLMSGVHCLFCVWHIMKVGEDEFCKILGKVQPMNVLDAVAHFISFGRIFIANQTISQPLFAMVYTATTVLYFWMRSKDLVW